MTQSERQIYLIRELRNEQPNYRDIQIPTDKQEQKELLRSLFNVRMPEPISDDFLKIQDEYLQEETARKGITDIAGCWAVSVLATAALITPFTPMPGYSFGLLVQNSCASRGMKKQQEKPRLQRRLICPVIMSCIPSVRLSTAD